MNVVPFESKLKPTGTWRNIIERSCMINNDEFVIYSHEQRKQEKDMPGRLRMSRPVFTVEIKDGLDPVAQMEKRQLSPQQAPKITLMLDAFFKLKKSLEGYQYLHSLREDNTPWNPAQALASIIGDNYYDCMTGGWDGYSIWAAHQLGATMNPNEQVYPKDNGWYTLGDFLADTQTVATAIDADVNKLLNQ